MLKARGFTVIWFAHNLTPHGWGGSVGEWFSHAHVFYEHVDAVAHLTYASTHTPVFDRFRALPKTVLRHPHYDLVNPAEHAGQARDVSRLLMLGGASQPRKNAYSAASAIQGVANVSAVITGDLKSKFAAGFASLPHVELVSGILDKRSLFALFDGGTSVLLNQPNQLNSGCMFLGLSRGAPVICPDTPANREIRSIVGPDWIRLFNPPISSEKISELVREPVPEDLPDLTPFAPEAIGRSFRRWVDQELLPSPSNGR